MVSSVSLLKVQRQEQLSLPFFIGKSANQSCSDYYQFKILRIFFSFKLTMNRVLGACYSYFVPWAHGPHPCAGEDKQVIHGHSHFTEYQWGSMNLIFSVPHGVLMEPKDIPDWEDACWDAKISSCIFSHECPPASVQNCKRCKVSTNKERCTIEVTQALTEEINEITDVFFAHTVIDHPQRFNMGANGDKEEASFGRAWLWISMGKHTPEQWIELRYTLSKACFHSGVFSALCSSVSHLASQLVSVSADTLVAGNRSLAKYIEEQNNSYVCAFSIQS